jgi:hypothetical protein
MELSSEDDGVRVIAAHEMKKSFRFVAVSALRANPRRGMGFVISGRKLIIDQLEQVIVR